MVCQNYATETSMRAILIKSNSIGPEKSGKKSPVWFKATRHAAAAPGSVPLGQLEEQHRQPCVCSFREQLRLTRKGHLWVLQGGTWPSQE